MGVKILSRLYTPTHEPEDGTDWLLGNVGDWQKAKFLVEAGVDFIASQSEPISIDTQEQTVKLMNGKKWSDYGFDVNQEVTVNYVKKITDDAGNETTTPITFTFQITQIYNDTIAYDTNLGFGLIGYDMIPTERANERIYGVKFYLDAPMQGARVKYNHISNEDVTAHSLNSFIDGNVTEGICANLQANVLNNFELIGKQSGMAISKITIIDAPNQDTGNISASYFIPSLPHWYVYDAVDTNFMIVIPPQFRSQASEDAIPITNPGITDFSDIIKVGNTIYSANQEQLFLYNSNYEGLLYMHLNLNITAIDTINEEDPVYIRLVLLKFTGGSSIIFQEKIIFKEWVQEVGANNVGLQFDDIVPFSVEEGTSYAFGIEYSAGAIQNVVRKLNAKINYGNFEIFQNIAGGENYRKKYEVEISYMISSFFESIDNFTALQAPQTVFDANSLTDVIDIRFYPKWNNPNVSIKNNLTDTERLGNTGWFFENFNGLTNNFEVSNIGYKDLDGNTVTSLSFGQPVRVRAAISGYQNLTEGETSVSYGFMWIPINEEDYKNKITPFHKNTKTNSPERVLFTLGSNSGTNLYEGYTNTPGEAMDVQGVNITEVNGNLIFEATFTPTPGLNNFFEARPEDRNYIIWLSVGEGSGNYSDRVSLLLDFNVMQTFIPISGELQGVTNKFLEHPESEEVAGLDRYVGFLEDDLLARSNFKIENGKRFERIILGYEIENIDTGEVYELDRFTANTQNFITNTEGRQEIDFNAIRGYKLQGGNNKNWVKILRDTTGDTAEKTSYTIFFAARIRWEDWIQRQNVPASFFNNQLPFNGSGNNWINYLRALGNYRVNFFILFDVNSLGNVLRYKNKFEITFNSYDENLNITTEHNYYRQDTNTLLNIGNDAETGRPLGMILGNKQTRIEIIYTKITGEWDLGNVYSITKIEVDKGEGVLEFRQLSSIWGSESGNTLIPLPGEVRLKVEQIAPNKIKTSCLVDYTALSPAERYKVSGRIGCFKNDNGTPIVTKVYDINNYENNYE